MDSDGDSWTALLSRAVLAVHTGEAQTPGHDDDHGSGSKHHADHLHKYTVGLLVFLIILSCTVGHKIAHSTRFAGEGSVACAFGLITAVLLLLLNPLFKSEEWLQDLLSFDPSSFFTYMLPPIIFYAGLSVKKKQFFRNFFTIGGLGILGTYICFAIIVLCLYGSTRSAKFITVADCLAMGAILAATDSVATLQVLNQERMPLLYSIVFGEGVINDATSIVVLSTVQGLGETPRITPLAILVIFGKFVLLFISSMLLGLLFGLATAFALRKLQADSTPQEVAVIGIVAYLSYIMGDVMGLSGILALFTCAVCISHYALHNISPLSRVTVTNAFHGLSYLSETMIFVYVGLDALDPLKWRHTDLVAAAWLIVLMTALLLSSRAIFVAPICLLHNRWSHQKLSVRDIVVVWWSGLMRGAVSVALVYHYFDPAGGSNDSKHATLISSTLGVVVISVMLFGAATQPLLDFLLPSKQEEGHEAGPSSKRAAQQQPKLSRTGYERLEELGDGPDGGGGGSALLTDTADTLEAVEARLTADDTTMTPTALEPSAAGTIAPFDGVVAEKPTSGYHTRHEIRVDVRGPPEQPAPAASGPVPAGRRGSVNSPSTTAGLGELHARRAGARATSTDDAHGGMVVRVVRNDTSAAEAAVASVFSTRVNGWWKRFDERYLQPTFGGPAMPTTYGDTIEIGRSGVVLNKKAGGH